MPADLASPALLVLAAGFAVVNGANDGAAIVSTGLKIGTVPPWLALLVVAAAVGVVPALLGTAVARTIVRDLLDYPPDVLPLLTAIAVVAAVLVVGVLTRLGLPTSLTLAFVGAIAGAATGLAQQVPWPTLGRVLAIGVAAPIVGAVVAMAVLRAAALLPSRGSVRSRAEPAHVVGFGLQCLAYGANDGQKMLAVLIVAAGAGGAAAAGGFDLPTWGLALLAGCFLLGGAVGLARAARTLGDEVLNTRPAQAAAAELSSASAVFGSAALGAPVSMTQAIAGGLVGAGASESYRKVRWRVAGQLGLAWLLTLPSAYLAAAAGSALARVAPW